MSGLSQIEATMLQTMIELRSQLGDLTHEVREMRQVIAELDRAKDWYSTTEVADLMKVTRYTVQERWCNQDRIECEKDVTTGKWRIPGPEYQRLRRGGQPLPG